MTAPAPNSAPAAVSKAEPWRSLGICLFLMLLTLGIYWQVGNFDFINYDDPDYVTANAHVQAGFTAETVRWAFTESHSSNWHPLTWLSHTLDWQIFGDKPAGHHLVNVLFHLLNTLLVFGVLRMMTAAVWRAAFVAAFFALHPVHIESVAWVSERKDVLSTFFGLLCIGAYVRYVRALAANGFRSQTIGWYVLALLLCACGLMSKPMLVTWPFVLWLLDYWPLHRAGTFTVPPDSPAEAKPDFSWKRFLRLGVEKIPFFALVALSSAVTFWAQRKGGAVTAISVLSPAERISNALISYARYLGKMFWPDSLSILYPHPLQWPPEQTALAGIFLATVTAFVIWQWRRRPYLALGWCWYLGTLVPVIGLVQVGLQSMADRYTYIPLLGIFVALVWWVADLMAGKPGGKATLGVVGAFLLLLCTAATANHLAVWRDSKTVFSQAVRVTEKNFLAHNNLGFHLYNHGEPEQAIEQYRLSLEAYTGFELSWNNMGYALAQQGKYKEAILHYRKALEIKPDQIEVLNNLGNALGNVGEEDEAMKCYRRVLELNPDHADALNNLGASLGMGGKLDEGIVYIRKSLALRPKNANAHSNLGNALAIQGKLDEAIEHFATALEIKDDEPQTHNNLANALSAKDRMDEAIAHYQTALKYNATNNPEAHCNLGFVLLRQNKFPDARYHLQEAVRQRPNYPEAQRQLDWLNANVKP